MAAARWVLHVREKNLDIKWHCGGTSTLVEGGGGGGMENANGRCQRPSTSLVGTCCAFLRGIGERLNRGGESLQPPPITYLWESGDPGNGVPIPLSPQQLLLPSRRDLKEDERERNLSDDFRRRKKWLSSMNDLWKRDC